MLGLFCYGIDAFLCRHSGVLLVLVLSSNVRLFGLMLVLLLVDGKRSVGLLRVAISTYVFCLLSLL